MSTIDGRSFCFPAEVVEEIHKDGSKVIKALCHPESFIMTISENGSYGLGDRIRVYGTMQIERLEKQDNRTTE